MQHKLFSSNNSLANLFKDKIQKQYVCEWGMMTYTAMDEARRNPPKIYDSNNLTQLLSLPESYENTPWNNEGSKAVDFLVRTDGELVFANSYAAFPLAIKNYQAGQAPFPAKCIAAGTAYFDINDNLYQISHKKNDELHLPYDSLHFALEAIVKNNIPLAEKVTIAGYHPQEPSTFSQEEIIAEYQAQNGLKNCHSCG